MRTLIVIPYIKGEAQGHELELALTGWRKHFKEPFIIAVVGDVRAEDSTEDCVMIPCPRVDAVAGQYRPHLDMVYKFRVAREWFPATKGFIYACDDMYAVMDFTLRDVQAIKRPIEFDIPPKDWRKESGWLSDLGKTWELNRRSGTPTNWNWVCHLPVYYEWDRLLDIYDRYDCDNVSYVVENIYFNQKKIPHSMIHMRAEYGHEVRMAWPDFYYTEETDTIWITNANCGWSEKLEERLREHYDRV